MLLAMSAAMLDRRSRASWQNGMETPISLSSSWAVACSFALCLPFCCPKQTFPRPARRLRPARSPEHARREDTPNLRVTGSPSFQVTSERELVLQARLLNLRRCITLSPHHGIIDELQY